MIDAKPMLAELLLVSLYEACLWLDSKNCTIMGVTAESPAAHYPMVAEQLQQRLARLRHIYVVQQQLPCPLTPHAVERFYRAWCRGSAKAKARTLAVLREQLPPPAAAAEAEKELRRKCRRCAHYPVHGSFPARCSGCRACSLFE